MKTNQELVKEIHTEFDTAADRMLAEANVILKTGFSKEKEARLSKLGFARSKQAVAFDKAEEQRTLILAYRQSYPAHKFITEEIVKQICEKYDLVLGNVSDFIGDVPEKNLMEMENFKVKKDDYRDTNTGWGNGMSIMDWVQAEGRVFRGVIDPYDGFMTTSPRRAGSDLATAFGYGMWADRAKKSAEKSPFQDKPQFKICAPETDFNTVGLKKEGHKLVPEDPIVLCPVKGGYLVVTKWGLEASDPSVMDERMN